MRTRTLAVAIATLFVAAGGVAESSTRQSQDEMPPSATPSNPAVVASRLGFEPNVGQFDDAVHYMTRSGAMSAFFTSEGIAFAFATPKVNEPTAGGHPGSALPSEDQVVTMRINGGDLSRLRPEDRLSGEVNYFVGSDPSRWRTNVPMFGRVVYTDAYPGIDLVFDGSLGAIEYRFIVRPGADPDQISIAFEGVDSMSLRPNGDLLLEMSSLSIPWTKPFSFQRSDGVRTVVESRYRILGSGALAFELGPFDRTQTLIIDPTLAYAYSFPGHAYVTSVDALTVDSSGAAYVAGRSRNAGYVAKINASGTSTTYVSYFAGLAPTSPTSPSDGPSSLGIAVDAAGAAYVAGRTESSQFPTVSPFLGTRRGSEDAVVMKLSPNGDELIYSTYLGGATACQACAEESEGGVGISVDAAGAAYVTGYTNTTDFPTASPLQSQLAGHVDVFVAKLSPGGSALVYSSYLGGGSTDVPVGIALDSSAAAHVAGKTGSIDFPTVAPAQPSLSGVGGDAFITKIAPSGSSILYSTYLGGSRRESPSGVALDSTGAAYLAGTTWSTDFPTRAPLQSSLYGESDVFVAKLEPSGNSLSYSTYLGGSLAESGNGIAVDEAGAAHVAGWTGSANFPWVKPLPNGDRPGKFALKFAPGGGSLEYATGIRNANEVALAISVDAESAAYVGFWDHHGTPLTDAAVIKIVIDRLPPDTSFDSYPSNPGNGSGTFSFTGVDDIDPTAALKFECSLDGGGFADCASPRTLSGLQTGTHTFRVRARDQEGNVDPSPASHTWFVDATEPETAILDGPSNPSPSRQASFRFEGSDNLTPPSDLRFECRLDGASFSVCTSPLTVSNLSSGEHTLLVRSVDGVGNVDQTPARYDFRVDLVPDTAIGSTPPDPSNAVNGSITFSGSDDLTDASLLTFECALDGSAFTSCSSPFVYSDLTPGTHVFSVRALDEVGNKDPSPSVFGWLIDTEPPDTILDSTPSSVGDQKDATFTFHAIDDYSVPGEFRFLCQLDAQGFTPCSSPHVYRGLSAGSHTFHVKAIDRAGNVDPSPATFTWHPPPRTHLTSVPADPSGPSVSFSFEASAGSGSAYTFECLLDTGAWVACASPAAYSGLASGPHRFQVRAIDGSGAADPAPPSYSWHVDGEPPISSFVTPSGSVVFNLPGFLTTTINGISSDEQSGVESVTVTFSSLGELQPDVSSPARLRCNGSQRSCAWAVDPPVIPGAYSVTVESRDRLGNVESPGPEAIIVFVI